MDSLELSDSDELRVLRARVEAIERQLDRLESEDVAGSLALAAKTVSLGSYPTSAANITFAVQALDISGPESEGAMPTISPRTTFFAVCLGGTLPLGSTEVIVHSVPYAWVFRF